MLSKDLVWDLFVAEPSLSPSSSSPEVPVVFAVAGVIVVFVDLIQEMKEGVQEVNERLG